MISNNINLKLKRNSLLLFGFLAVLSLGFLGSQDAHAATNTLNGSFCGVMGGTWSPNTCTITSDYKINSSDTLSIQSGTILVISSSSVLIIEGTLDNSGTIEVYDSSTLRNYSGTLNNSGTITVSNTSGNGIHNRETLNNSGIIIVSNSGGTGIDNYSGTINNYLVIHVHEYGTITNSGTMLNDNGVFSKIYLECNGVISGTISGNLPIDLCIDDDGDGIPNYLDNCYDISNFNQSDIDNDGIGDVCDFMPNGDDDGDGIDDAVDLDPSIFSSEFQNGGTSGEIISGQGSIWVSGLSDNEIQIIGTGAVSACDNTVMKFVDDEDNASATIECGSIFIDVIQGEIQAELTGIDGSTAISTLDSGDSFFFDDETFTMETLAGDVEIALVAEDGIITEISLSEGNSITVDPVTSIITAGPDNTSDVTITVDGQEKVITPGESVILSPEQAIQNLIDKIISMNLQKGTENSLTSNLDSAIDKLIDNNTNNDSAACGKLDSFENKVDAQDGKKLTTEQAETLRGLVTDIKDVVNCI